MTVRIMNICSIWSRWEHFGLITYVGLIITSIRNCVKTWKDEPVMLAVLMLIVSYITQAFVNVEQPITTPFLFFICGDSSRNTQKQSEKKQTETRSCQSVVFRCIITEYVYYRWIMVGK